MPDDFISALVASGKLRPRQRTGTREEPTNEEFAGQIAENLEETGESPSILERGTNILGKVFDVLSRPNYAVAEASQEILEGGNPVEGFFKGLAGREKTSFSDVLETAGVENRFIKGVGGLALDIALDPTTYLGGGIVKGVSRDAIGTIGGRAAAAEVGSKVAQDEAAKVGLDAGRKAFEEAGITTKIGKKVYKQKGTGKFISKDDAIKFGVQEGELAKTEHLRSLGIAKAQAASSSKEASEQGRVVLKLLGKEIAGSERLYKGGQALATRAKGRPGIQAINKAFRNNAIFVSGLNDLRRRAETVNIARYEQAVRRISKLFDGLTPEQHKLIIDAWENGTDLTAEGLEQHRTWLKEFMETTNDLEIQAGIANPLDAVNNYVYHIFDPSKNDSLALEVWDKEYKDAIKKSTDARKAAIKKGLPDPGVPKNEFTLARAAQERGLVPEYDIRDIVAGRLAKSYSMQGNKKFIDDAIGEFGVFLNDPELAKRLGLTASNVKYAKEAGVYFPPEIEKSLREFNKYMGNDASTRELLGLYDNVLSAIKFNQTVVNPGHHIRNLLGDIWLNHLDGVVDPSVYKLAARVQNRVKTFEGIDDYRQIGNIVEDQMSPSIKTQFGDRALSEEDIYSAFLESGSKSGFYKSEFSGAGENLGKTVTQKISKKLRNVSEGREDFARLGHFIDALKKEAKPGMNEIEWADAVQKAGARVRKFNFDYGDLTEFERRKLKRIIPYYTWLRKNTPLQLESLALRPGRQLVAPKFMNAMEVMAGTEDWEPTVGPLTAIPSWLKDASAVALGKAGNGMFWNPQVLPVMSLDETLGQGMGPGGVIPDPMEFLKTQMAGTSPMLRIPVEQIADYSFFRDGPENASNLETLRDLTPIGRLTGRGYNTVQGSGEGGQGLRPEDLASWLLGISVVRPSDSQVRGELRRQEDIVQRIMRDRRGTE